MTLDKGQYILVTGCGRSGTKYMSQLLSDVGLDVKHETIGKNGLADWHSAILRQPENVIVLHQTREPLVTISSLQTFSQRSWEYVSKFIPLPEDLIERCMIYWLYWNRLTTAIQDRPLLYQVELVHQDWKKICHHINISAETRMPKIPKNANTRHLSYPMLEWWILEDCNQKLVGEIREQAAVYGYEMCYDD